MIKFVDKIMLRLARDTYQLYSFIAGEDKYRCAFVLYCVAWFVLVVSMTTHGALMVIYDGPIIINIFLSTLSTLYLPLCYFSIKQHIKSIKLIKEIEEISKEHGLMVPPDLYDAFYKSGRFWAIFSFIFILLPPHNMLTIFYAGGLILAVSEYIVCIDNVPPGKNIFERIKDKVKTLVEASAMPEPVKVEVNTRR